MKVLDLFSGIGGFSLGLERAGFETIAFCEIEPYCQKVLKKHWPDIPIYEDVRNVTRERLEADGIFPDVITGGFPCQDISNSGYKTGVNGSRTGLYTEIVRLASELRPRYIFLENVAALLHRGMGDVIGSLARIGYDAEWQVIPAWAVGGFHKRDRVWIIAYPEGRRPEPILQKSKILREKIEQCTRLAGRRRNIYSPDAKRYLWEDNTGICRVADDVPARVDRIRSLGNAVVPQIPEIIGRAIMEAENENNN